MEFVGCCTSPSDGSGEFALQFADTANRISGWCYDIRFMEQLDRSRTWCFCSWCCNKTWRFPFLRMSNITVLRWQLLWLGIPVTLQHRWLHHSVKIIYYLIVTWLFVSRVYRRTGSSEPESNVRAVSRSGPSNGASSGRMAPIHSDSEHSLASGSTEDCWRGSYHHALAVVEHRGEEMPSLFDQLHELHNDLSSINDQVTQSLQQCRSRRRPASESGRSSCLVRRRRCFGSCQDVHGFTEDQMAFILHRLLTRICELFLARQEGIQVVPLIV